MAAGNGKCTQDTDFVFYGNLEHPSKAVVHTGDNRTGEGEGDDEVINVDLSLVPDRIERIATEELGMHKAETEDIVRVEMNGVKK